MSGGFNAGDLARWALGGGASTQDGEEQEGTATTTTPMDDSTPMTAEQLREQRMARLSQPQTSAPTKSSSETAVPMQVDEKIPAATTTPSATTTTVSKASPPPAVVEQKTTPKSSKEPSTSLHQRKVQRKKELLIKKTLQITLAGGAISSSIPHDKNITEVDIGTTEITVGTIAEILVARLGSTTGPLFVSYLGKAYQACTEEASRGEEGLQELIEELKSQIVAYAATCVVEPDLFTEISENAPKQLADALMQENLVMSATGFYGKLVDELELQRPEILQATVESVVNILLERLKSEGKSSILESGMYDPFTVAAALKRLCSKKNVAAMVTKLDSFLLPKEGTEQAREKMRPQNSATTISHFLALAQPPYSKRSGPGLERHTLLGALLRYGLPRATNTIPEFAPSSVLRLPQPAVEKVMKRHRERLHTYQQTVYALVKTLLTSGAESRNRVLTWITDALLVNTGASALRLDSSKVSSPTLLMNLTVLLLDLCAPFMGKTDKIHAAFVSSQEHHGGVFITTGDDAVPRLGEGSPPTSEYKPKNSFVPSCFFFCARSLHYSLVSLLSQHDNLLRHIHHLHHEITAAGNAVHTDNRFAQLISRQRSDEVSLFQDEFVEPSLRFCDFIAQVLCDYNEDELRSMPEDFCTDICAILLGVAQQKPKKLMGISFQHVFRLVVKLLSPHYATVVRNYNLRAQLGDILYELFLPQDDRDGVPSSVAASPGGQTYLLFDTTAQESLAPSLLLLYGEVEHTGFYDKMSHRAKIASLIKYLWDSTEHRQAFRKIAKNTDSFIKFANGIMNETNNLISTIMQKLPEIREAQETMGNTETWGGMSEEEQGDITSRLEENERNVKSSLPLCNKTLQMFGYLNTDEDIQKLFLLDGLCSRLVKMLVHVLTKLVGSRGLELKVENPEQYEFRPKELLRDLCAIFALFSGTGKFQEECARSGCDPQLLRTAVKTCRRHNLLTGESMETFSSLPDAVVVKQGIVNEEEKMLADAPDEFLDPILTTFMHDPVRLPSGNTVDRSTITQHLLNDPNDPFSRAPLSVEDLVPDVELKARMEQWLLAKEVPAQSPGDPMEVDE